MAYIIGLFLFFLVVIIKYPSFLVKQFAKFLIVHDKEILVDVIIVIGGWESQRRKEYAAELYKKGLGQVIFVSGSGTQESEEKVFEKLGVKKNILITETLSTSTYENAIYTRSFLQDNGYKTFILVCSPAQSRRARFIFRKVYKKTKIHFVICPTKNSLFHPNTIMNNKSCKEELVLETIKLFYYYIKYLLV